MGMAALKARSFQKSLENSGTNTRFEIDQPKQLDA
jgi:hypothetical protein